MDAIKIEMGAILKLKQVIYEHDLMHDYISNNDKEPSWDGFIYLYKSSNLNVENIRYRIPIQVKGKNQQELLNRKKIQYPVEYKHLRNYYHDGGVFYVVVVISDDGKDENIYYNALTTIKLADMLKGAGNKQPDQHKSICLMRLEKNYSDNLYKVLTQFGMDTEKQGRGNNEIIRKAININTINQVESIRATSCSAKSETDILDQITTGDINLYGYRADIDMWLPFDYSLQKKMVIKKINTMNKSLGIDGVNYYESYLVEGMISNKDNPIIRVSENLTIDLMNGKFRFDAKGNLESLLRDVNFIKALKKGDALFIDNKKIMNLSNVKIPKKLEDEINMILDLNSAFKEIGFICNKEFKDYSNDNWKYINELLMLYQRKIKPKQGSKDTWYMWYWDGKVVPLYLFYNDKGKLEVINWFTTKKYYLLVEMDKPYILPKFCLFKRDILENLYDVDRSIWIEELERVEFTENIIPDIYQSFVEILAAYDTTKNEVYYDVAILMVEKVLKILPNDNYGIINKMQLLKRKRNLTEEEILRLEKIEEKSDDLLTKCAVNILLENKRNAQKLISELSEQDQRKIMNYPIYNLL